jgi:hypothetical protein
MKTHENSSHGINTYTKESSVVSLDIVHGNWQCGQGVGVDWIFDNLFDCNVNWCRPLHDENLCFECFISHSNEGKNINGVLANLIIGTTFSMTHSINGIWRLVGMCNMWWYVIWVHFLYIDIKFNGINYDYF